MSRRDPRPRIDGKKARGLAILAMLGRENTWSITLTREHRDELHTAIEYAEELSKWQARK